MFLQILKDSLNTGGDNWLLSWVPLGSLCLSIASLIMSWIALKRKHIYKKEEIYHQAQTDYEYDARKNLYSTYQPLFFQLAERSEIALSRIEAVTKSIAQGTFDEDWQNNNTEYYSSTIYKIFSPLSIIYQIKKSVNIVDFNVDDNLRQQYLLCKLLYEVFNDDGKISKIIIKNKDSVQTPFGEIYVDFFNKLQERAESYHLKWIKNHATPDQPDRQNITSIHLDSISKMFIKQKRGGKNYLLIRDYDEFYQHIYTNSTDLEKLRDILYKFMSFNMNESPENGKKKDQSGNISRKPVYWVMWLSIACLYFLITKSRNKNTINENIDIFFKKNISDFQLKNDNKEHIIYGEFAKIYIKDQIKKYIDD